MIIFAGNPSLKLMAVHQEEMKNKKLENTQKLNEEKRGIESMVKNDFVVFKAIFFFKFINILNITKCNSILIISCVILNYFLSFSKFTKITQMLRVCVL